MSELNRVLNADFRKVDWPVGEAQLAIVDPPYNIGRSYDDYDDNRPAEDYMAFTREWLEVCKLSLRPDGALWVVISDEYVAEVNLMAKSLGFIQRAWVIWYITFGAARARNFARTHVHLMHFVRGADFVFNTHDVRVPSARQLKYNDKRANLAGKLPDDVWILHPDQVAECFADPNQDTWLHSRICGTFKERKDVDNQLPEALVERMILSTSDEFGLVIDPMCGAGTVPAVARRLNRRWLAAELSPRVCEIAQQRVIDS